MNKQKCLNILAILLFLFVIIGLPLLSQKLNNNNAKSTVPSIQLYLGNTTLEAIHASGKQEVFDGNRMVLSDDFGIKEIDNVSIRRHGNSTLNLDKKSYQLRLKNRTIVFGMQASRKWVLLADLYDNSLLRNDLAFYIERMIGEEYALDGRFTELSIDGQDLGLYYMTPKVEISKNSVNLSDDYGILVEMENLHAEGEACYRTKTDECLAIRDSVNKDKSEEAMEEFVNRFNSLMKYAAQKDFDEVEKIIDVDSFAKYFLLSEFAVNPDAYTTSAFFYMDGLEDKLHAGPGWDFDFAFGNRLWAWGVNLDFYSPDYDLRRKLNVFGGEYRDEKTGEKIMVPEDKKTSKLFYYLIDIPEFKQVVDEIFKKTMSGKCEETIKYINSQREFIHGAALYDSEIWNRSNLEEETDYLIEWVRKRFEHFEYEYGTSHLQPWDKAFVL